MFLSCKHFKLGKRHTISNSKHNGKTSGKYDFKYILSNLQHQDHKLQQMMLHLLTPQVSTHETSKGVRNSGNPKRGGIPKISLKLIVNPIQKSLFKVNIISQLFGLKIYIAKIGNKLFVVIFSNDFQQQFLVTISSSSF